MIFGYSDPSGEPGSMTSRPGACTVAVPAAAAAVLVGQSPALLRGPKGHTSRFLEGVYRDYRGSLSKGLLCCEFLGAQPKPPPIPPSNVSTGSLGCVWMSCL